MRQTKASTRADNISRNSAAVTLAASTVTLMGIAAPAATASAASNYFAHTVPDPSSVAPPGSAVGPTEMATTAEVAARNLPYSFNKNKGFAGSDAIRWIDRTKTSNIVIVAPHAVVHHRNGHLKAADTFTGGLAETLADRIGASVLTTTGEVSDWNENWQTRNDEFTHILHSLPKSSIIVDLHGMDNSSSKADISVGKSKKDSGATKALAKEIRDQFHGDTVIDGKFNATGHYTVIRHMQERGHDGVQVEISERFRNPAKMRVGHTVDALARALNQTDQLNT
ncbi:hypothetical protein [Corynebacterium bovis]|uniref:hypothetical protein n=1 Tax=Corynebacterium bovis TaxID=36808 RepID=UPI000F649E00|nr:hypothetical protein [Corynebacterium bovis]